MKIVVAGASGFIGKELIDNLKDNHKIIALSRSKKENDHKNIEWRQCDLYSIKSIEDCIQDATVAVYLVHSMLPSNRLTQGNFMDMDDLLADNFHRAIKKSNIKKIIYVSESYL